MNYGCLERYGSKGADLDVYNVLRAKSMQPGDAQITTLSYMKDPLSADLFSTGVYSSIPSPTLVRFYPRKR